MTPAWRKLTAKKFLKMLEGEDACGTCPFTFRNSGCFVMARIFYRSFCSACQSAVGLGVTNEERCPCWRLGPAEAVKRAWLFVEDSRILEAPDAPL